MVIMHEIIWKLLGCHDGAHVHTIKLLTLEAGELVKKKKEKKKQSIVKAYQKSHLHYSLQQICFQAGA